MRAGWWNPNMVLLLSYRLKLVGICMGGGVSPGGGGRGGKGCACRGIDR